MFFDINNEIKLLSLGFFSIFMSYVGVQQYITTFFSQKDLTNVGFQSLILIYIFFILCNPLAAILVSKIGAKNSMVISSVFYSVFILSLLTNSLIVIYLASLLLGAAASLLWVGQNSYLVRVSDKKSYGKNSGFFNTLYMLGGAVGILILGYLIPRFHFALSFLVFSVFPLLGFAFFVKLKNIKMDYASSKLNLFQKSLKSLTALRLSTIWFVYSFVSGLIIGTIPLNIKNTLGIDSIGFLTSLFWIIPILFSYLFGKMSDNIGRKKFISFSFIIALLGLILLSTQNALFLILGVIFLAINYAILRPITMALVGDLSTDKNVEFISALFWMVQGVGTVLALIIPAVGLIKVVYIISSFTLVLSFIIYFPLFRLKLTQIQFKIAEEME